MLQLWMYGIPVMTVEATNQTIMSVRPRFSERLRTNDW